MIGAEEILCRARDLGREFRPCEMREFVPKKQEMYQSGWIAARVTHLLRAGLLRKTMRGRYLITAGQADRSEAP